MQNTIRIIACCSLLALGGCGPQSNSVEFPSAQARPLVSAPEWKAEIAPSSPSVEPEAKVAEPSEPLPAQPKARKVPREKLAALPRGADVKVVDRAGLDRALKELQGEVVFIDFWATWCTTCVEFFPHTEEIQRKYGDRIVVIGMSLDEGSDAEALENVRKFLGSRRVDFANFVSPTGASSETMEAFELPQGVPHFRVLDRSGKAIYAFSGLPKEGEIEAKIEAALAE